MDKAAILDAIIRDISESLEGALIAADEAHATATNKENAAENKYDTLGLEAAYLAHGQSERVVQLERDLAAFSALKERLCEHDAAETGSLVQLEPESGAFRYVFIGPSSGGLQVSSEGTIVTVITPASPLGSSLLGARPDDEVLLDTSTSPLTVSRIW